MQDPNRILAYNIPISALPDSTANLHNDYRDVEATIEFKLENGREVKLSFPPDGGIIFRLDSEEGVPPTLAEIKRRYPINVISIPVLNLFEEKEKVLNEQYYEQEWTGRRSSRMFRNYWHRNLEYFDDFSGLISSTWPGIRIKRPELVMAQAGSGAQMTMYYEENRIDREIFWSGFGFQIWMQLITHLISCGKQDVLIIDEPDIYLHPDLQRKLITYIQNIGCQYILATHSVEIINEAPLSDIVSIDPKKRRANRLSDISSLQETLGYIGSSQNVELAKLSRNRRMVFFEGSDFKLIRQFARRTNLENLRDALNFSIIPIGGFSRHIQISSAVWVFETILQSDMEMLALFDRDYRPDDEVDEFLNKMRKDVPNTFVLNRKEIENYLLDRIAIRDTVFELLKSKNENISKTEISKFIDESFVQVFEELKSGIIGSVATEMIRFYRTKGIDPSTCVNDAIGLVEEKWKNDDTKLLVVPGKIALSKINGRIQKQFGISLTSNRIIQKIRKGNIPDDLMNILGAMEDFASIR